MSTRWYFISARETNIDDNRQCRCKAKWGIDSNEIPGLLSQGNTRARWRHQIETFSALLAICAGNSPVPGEFPAQRPVTRSFDVFFDLCLNKRLSKQSWGWWFETLSCPLWRHRNGSWLPRNVYLKLHVSLQGLLAAVLPANQKSC